jgi:hypothetical protein
MNRLLLTIAATVATAASLNAIDNNTVEIVYNGTTATVSVASNISGYVTVASGSLPHVILLQDSTFAGVDATADNPDGEITYILSGSSADGAFYMEGAFKATVELNGLTLTNPSGPAIAIMDGKRIAISAKKGTTNTLADGVNDSYNGCLHCKGHTKLKGKGTLNITGNSRHAVYSKEYLEVKNMTLNILAAAKDGMHCKEYFLMESGAVSIRGTGDDGIQVERDGTVTTEATTGHEDEDTGNFYMTGGSLSIAGYQGKAVKADGTVTFGGGTRDFNAEDVETMARIGHIATDEEQGGANAVYGLGGQRLKADGRLPKGVCIIRQNGKIRKAMR